LVKLAQPGPEIFLYGFQHRVPAQIDIVSFFLIELLIRSTFVLLTILEDATVVTRAMAGEVPIPIALQYAQHLCPPIAQQ
jgi:hypothetical protein